MASALEEQLLQLEGIVRAKSKDGRCQGLHAQKPAVPRAVTGLAVGEEVTEGAGETSRIQHSSLKCGNTSKVCRGSDVT